MEKNIHTYDSDDLTIEFDQNRCLHAGECVGNMSEVFNPQQDPWIQPEEASADQLKDVVHHCPTGALQYTNDEQEKPARQNTITVTPDGPLYLRGDIEVQDAEGETILKDTRVALCRCGSSENKPLCDNSHEQIDFSAPAGFNEAKLKPSDSGNTSSGKLIVKLMDNGPMLLEGSYRVHSIANATASSSKNVAMCRCGKTESKPFCDGTHKDIGFEG